MADEQHGDESDNSNGKTDDAKKYVTPEELNKAITGHLQRFEKKQVTSFATLLDEKLAALKPPPPADDDEEDEDDDKPPPKLGDGTPDIDAAIAKERKRIEKKAARERADDRKRIEKLELERASEQKAAADMKLRHEVRDALVEHGVDAQRIKQAMAWLIDGERRAFLDEDGHVKFRDVDDETIEVTVAEGVQSWVKTDDAKVFLPPRGAGGSGDNPTRGKLPPADAAQAERDRVILQGFFGN